MFLHLRTLCLLTTSLLLSGCLPSLPAGDLQPGVTYRVATETRFQLARRTFLLHTPADYPGGSPLPLVIVLHGAFSTARQTEAESGLSALADTERFLVAYPEGIGLFGYLQHWNAGHCCGKAADDNIDDVGFILEVMQTVQRRLAVDPQRVYLVGMSNGGMLVHLLAAEHGNLFAAAAVISGALSSTTPGQARWHPPLPIGPLPMLLIHGDADQHIPINGGASTLSGRQTRSYSPFMEAARHWAEANGCPDPQPSVRSATAAFTRSSWCGDQETAGVETILVRGGRHRWPPPYVTDQLPAESPLAGYDIRRELWTFLSSFQRR